MTCSQRTRPTLRQWAQGVFAGMWSDILRVRAPLRAADPELVHTNCRNREFLSGGGNDLCRQKQKCRCRTPPGEILLEGVLVRTKTADFQGLPAAGMGLAQSHAKPLEH